MVSLRPRRRTPLWRTHLSDPASSIFPAAKASAETTIAEVAGFGLQPLADSSARR
ncbi:hypothetical protein ACTJKE_05585 [Ensifer sp. 22521]|uniref:hypothetical protein n=1 Tax=Ensifer sp. 22521 TaxID=3453935 RepID=UPI003F87D5FF